jgi:hypothetical protein
MSGQHELRDRKRLQSCRARFSDGSTVGLHLCVLPRNSLRLLPPISGLLTVQSEFVPSTRLSVTYYPSRALHRLLMTSLSCSSVLSMVVHCFSPLLLSMVVHCFSPLLLSMVVHCFSPLLPSEVFDNIVKMSPFRTSMLTSHPTLGPAENVW